ncbi:MAG: hypothetical protein M3068_15080 [Gemmatimonadota bacterium]|nr:hypothetical protein [Gemmatimonadota bacterium]
MIASSVAAVSAGAAQQSALKRVPFLTAKQACDSLAVLTAPPPPIGREVVGTLDAVTGTFTWNPAVQLRDAMIKPPDLNKPGGVLGPVFDVTHIRVITPNLGPAVVSLPPGILLNPNFLANTGALAGAGVNANAATAAGAPALRRATVPTGGPGNLPSRSPITDHPGRGKWYYLPVNGGMQDLVFRVTKLPAGGQFSVTIAGRTATNAGSADPSTIDIIVPVEDGAISPCRAARPRERRASRT